MCMYCSALCDKCKPAELKGVVCPECGKAAMYKREDFLYALGYWKRKGSAQEQDAWLHERFRCKKCGTDLLSEARDLVRPVPCAYSGIICGYPCGRSNRERGLQDDPCKKQVIARSKPQ
jgi:hypothetical protein